MENTKQSLHLKNQQKAQNVQQKQNNSDNSSEKKHVNNIDSIVRPIIDSTQRKIQEQFRSFHNHYLLEGYRRKANCFERYLKPLPVLKATEAKLKNQNTKQSNKNQTLLNSRNNQTEDKKRQNSDQILAYYACFGQQIQIANERYVKIYKKSEDNKMRLINCIQKCSANSKNQNQIFETCAQTCKDKYIGIMSNLYTNFYSKFLPKQ